MAPHSLGASLKSIALSHASCVCLRGVMDKVSSVSDESHRADSSSRQTAVKHNSKIWLEDPLQRELCQNNAGTCPTASLGRPTELAQRNTACSRHARLSLVGASRLKRCTSVVPFSFKEWAKEMERNQCFKVGNIFLIPGTVCTVYLKNEGDQLPSTSMPRTACG